ncbi:Ethanolamine ammonia-lyase light chain [Mucilaginibacter lappiensis]|uniref:Ethanolamine ammonia-lyase small subunit n=1 Tax=Mucilaginibacter lappiensis TaxID=354630 RepID=A0ABR6PM58_9SPHI|nr:ethanolamine ammonia-lyase subunit EutC [Mucilaginibacter lappiensis]MBB6109351.1 ethanolamine ammonia-lyase small subunit [Mucilaginibacter lappiensis]SIQ98936.1 Ethanolamine ammonia-lyase light chain [Mucilaginibacter lappiensis]
MKRNIPQEILPLKALQEFTPARIGLGRVGTSIPLKQSLEFKLAHAHARDAVYSELDINSLTDLLKLFGLPVLHLQSRVGYREQYLQRPDMGRRLNKESIDLLQQGYYVETDIAVIIVDGLSATAVNKNSLELLQVLIPQLTAAGFKLTPISLVEQGRVAIGDDIGHGLKAKLSLILIGERPGLSSADSLGVYLTYGPKPGLTDEARNCVSNIRPGGLSYAEATKKIFYLISEAFKRKSSGVMLKDNAGLLES